MPKFSVVACYTSSRFVEREIEAENEEQARRIANTWLESEDTSSWQEHDDVDYDVYVEKV